MSFSLSRSVPSGRASSVGSHAFRAALPFRFTASNEVFKACDLLCQNRADFAEMMFPYLVYDCIANDDKDGRLSSLLSGNINRFLLAKENASEEVRATHDDIL